MDHQLGLPSDDDEQPTDRPTAGPTEGVRIIGAEEAAEAMERGDVAPRRGGKLPRFGDRPSPPLGPRPALRFPLDASADANRIERPPVQPAPDPVTGPIELPHWTEPATGEVPQVLIGDDAPLLEETDEDLDAWSSFATSTPRWRDADDSWDEDATEYVAGLAHDDESRVGALADPDARPTHDEFFSFHDLEEQVEERTSGSTRAVAAGETDGEDRSAPLAVPPWASLPDADNFHDASASAGANAYRSANTTTVGAGQEWADSSASSTGTGSVGRSASAVYDDEADDVSEDEVPPADDKERSRGGATRLSRRRKRQADKEQGDSDGDDSDDSDDSDGGGRDVGAAIVVGVLLLGVFAVLMLIGPGWAMALVALVVFLAAGEFFDALRRVGFESATLFGLVGCVAFPLAVYWRGLPAFPLLSVLALVGCLVWYLAGAGGPNARVIEGAGSTLFGIAWIGGLGSFAAAMLRAPDGRALFLIATLATVGYDVGGFFIGRNAGQRHLSDASPNKTVEGLLGGMAACVVVVVVAVGAIHLGPWDGYGPAIVLGLGAAMAAPLGDLCQSRVKRDLGVKDMGTILPGHGGVFDRFDALLFVLPTIYYLVTIVGHRI